MGSELELARQPKNLVEWSLMVRARDKVCQKCGIDSPLVAHHIQPKSLHPELALVLSNGMTLCSNCHTKHHAEHKVRGSGPRKKSAEKRTKSNAALLDLIVQLRESEVRLLKRCSELELLVAKAEATVLETENAYISMMAFIEGE